MRRIIIFLSALFAAVCITFMVISPDYLSMAIVGVMTIAIALGLVFGIIPILRYSKGFRYGRTSIERAREINADFIWTSVDTIKPFFAQKRLDGIFDEYVENVKEQKEQGVVISDIDDVINEDTIALYSWRGTVLQVSGILTALGLLGTFIGLVTGISSVSFVSADATRESIELLLEGIATAFYTSIVGVILSIIFNIAYRVSWNITMREMQLFIEQFHTQIQPTAEEQIRAKQYLNTERMIETLEVLRTNSSLSLSQGISDPAQEQRLMMDVISGLRRGEFTYMLMPICNLSDRSVIKAESKLQWNHPVLGAVQPSVYMPIVEADGFVAKLDQYVWDEVCSTMRSWIDSGVHPAPIVLNIRKTDLLALDVYETISELIDEYGLEPRNIGVAIDATAYVICHDEAIQAEKQFLQSGIKVSIHNCTGNLVSLGDSAADEISLDLDHMDSSEDIESIFAQAKRARLNITCAGIGSAKTLADVKRYGCLVGQGVHLYPDMTRNEFATLMNYKVKNDDLDFDSLD